MDINHQLASSLTDPLTFEERDLYRLTRVDPEKEPLNVCVCVTYVCLNSINSQFTYGIQGRNANKQAYVKYRHSISDNCIKLPLEEMFDTDNRELF